MLDRFWSRFKKIWSQNKALPWFVGLVSLLGVVLLVVFLQSSGSASGEIRGGEQVSSISLIVDVLIKFGIVLFLIYALYQLLGRFKKRTGNASSSRMQVLETLKLSPQGNLHLIQVHDRVMLVGATDQSLTKISDLDLSPETLDEYQQTPSPQSFQAAFQQVLQGKLGSSNQE